MRWCRMHNRWQSPPGESAAPPSSSAHLECPGYRSRLAASSRRRGLSEPSVQKGRRPCPSPRRRRRGAPSGRTTGSAASTPRWPRAERAVTALPSATLRRNARIAACRATAPWLLPTPRAEDASGPIRGRPTRLAQSHVPFSASVAPTLRELPMVAAGARTCADDPTPTLSASARRRLLKQAAEAKLRRERCATC